MANDRAFAIRINNDLPGLLPDDDSVPLFRSIETNFTKKPILENARSQQHCYAAVEPLLDEITTLLGRCLANRRYKYDLEEKAINLWLTHRRDTEANDYRRKIISSGEFKVNAETAKIERDFHLDSKHVIERAKDAHQRSINLRDLGDLVARERILKTSDVTGYLSPHSAAAVKPISERLEEIRLLYEVDPIVASHADAESRELLNATQCLTLEKRLPVLDARQDIEQTRVDTEQEILDYRESVSSTSGSALNFCQRIGEVQRLFDIDFANAISRAESVAKGLELIFKVKMPVPDLSSDSALTNLLVWAREVLEIVDAKNERAVNLRHSICINNLLSSEEWLRLMNCEKVDVDIGTMSAAFFTSERLRGLRFYLKGFSGQDPGTLLFTAPPLFPEEPVAERTGLIGDLHEDDMVGRYGSCWGRSFFNRQLAGRWTLQFNLEPDKAAMELAKCQLYLDAQILAN
jgi:hypothetical protein